MSKKNLVLAMCVAAGFTGHAAPRHGMLLRPQVARAYERLPLAFERNQGQTSDEAAFVARTAGQTIFLTSNGAVLRLARPKPTPTRGRIQAEMAQAVLKMTFVGANAAAQVSGEGLLPGAANYFVGRNAARWRTNVSRFGKVQYRDLYAGIDIVYYGNQASLEYDVIVRPQADVRQILIGFEGAERLDVDNRGDLLLTTAIGTLVYRKPLMYQTNGSDRRRVDGHYVVRDRTHVGFETGAYDRSRALIIDPILFYSTFAGGSGYDAGWDIAVDAAGNAYVTGTTSSVDFPATTGSYDSAYAAAGDAFVLKLNSTGSGLFYATYLGGTGTDAGQAIAIDASGNAYITGNTTSGDFPVTHGTYDETFGGSFDAWVTKLDSSGSSLVYSTYLGGSDADFGGQDIAVDAAGNAYITGETRSSDFPTTVGAYQTTRHGFQDATVTKLDTSGSVLIYSTFLGGSDDRGGPEDGFGISVDASGNAYVAGRTSSSDFPTTPLAYDTTYNGGIVDAFAAKLNASGSGLVYSTYLGGTDNDQAYEIPLDASGNAYLAGFTSSTDFPVSAGAFQGVNAGDFDAFVVKLDPVASALLYSTYLGGSGEDQAWGLGVDASGQAYVTGYTRSTNFPVSANAFQAAYGGGPSDGFVTKLNGTASGVLFSSYLGGASDDWGLGIALDALPSPNAYVTGQTGSVDFPTTSGAFQSTYGGGSNDAFVVRILDVVLPPPVTVGKVTGGGSITRAQGIGTFGFIVQREAAGASITGNLQYVRHDTHEAIRSTSFTTFVIADNTATVTGACTDNGVACTFSVTVEDNGEPGKDDTFTITINGGAADGGVLRSGNIKIHD